MRIMKWLTLLVVFSFLGCATGGGPSSLLPQTTKERIAASYATITATRATATELLRAKRITPDDAENVENAANVGRAGLDVARKLAATDETGAAAKLNAVMAGVRALQDYLEKKK